MRVCVYVCLRECMLAYVCMYECLFMCECGNVGRVFIVNACVYSRARMCLCLCV